MACYTKLMTEKINPSDQELLDDLFANPPNVDGLVPPEDSPEYNAYLEAKVDGTISGAKIGGQFLTEEANSQKLRAEVAEQKLKLDSKSGLATELYWQESLKEVFENLNDDDKLIVMVGDLNNFKIVNDTMGHEAGDRLLGIVGQAFKEVFKRESDFLSRGNRDSLPESTENNNTNEPNANLARLGGDEFAIFTKISPKNSDENREFENSENTILKNSIRLNSKITELLKDTEFEKFGISIALGGVEYSPETDKIPRDTFVRADAKMYEVKYKGKVDKLTNDDIQKLVLIIPYLEGIGARVENWLKDAVYDRLSESANSTNLSSTDSQI